MAAPRFFRDNGLSICLGGLALVSLGGHAWAGFCAQNQEHALHRLSPMSFGTYLTSAAFSSSLFENWESEFLQMALFVVLTVGLRQRGSAESKPLKEDPPRERPLRDAPWPMRRGGLWLKLYEHSLSLALFSLFLASFVAHWWASYHHYATEQAEHRAPLDHGFFGHLLDSQLWFESFQNWQSEFLSIAVLVLLTIFLREKGSAQSKDVAAPHGETGD